MVHMFETGKTIEVVGHVEYSPVINKWRSTLTIKGIVGGETNLVSDEVDTEEEAAAMLNNEMNFITQQLKPLGYDDPIQTITDLETGHTAQVPKAQN